MNNEEGNEALYPIAVLIDELKNDDISLRLNAIKRLSTIALALGAERTREELIPFLDESIDDEDEVLLALSEELGNFVPYVGGPQYAHFLLGPLENLAAIEETVVRDKAVESLNKIVEVLSDKQIEEHFCGLIRRLAAGDWFTSRTSACGLFTAVYPRCSAAIQEELRKIYRQLCRDDTPMVRRAAATQLVKFTKVIQKQFILSEIIPTFTNLAQDEQDSVRLLTVEVMVSIIETLAKDEYRINLLDAFKHLCNDRSWRVRYMVADNYTKICKALSVEIMKDVGESSYNNLLKDSEAEVRTAAIGQIP
ncbi:hypothetical protein PIROE2DRAFT_18997, partial [Piromyces sp. E2]